MFDVGGAQVLATIGYLIPLFSVLALRCRRDTPTWQLGLDVPAAIAADLVVTLALTRLMPLAVATVVSRAGWIALVAWRCARPDRRPRWPEALTARDVVAALLVVAVAVHLSMRLSRTCVIWDREWHIPLVAALRGQRLPFMNVYEPGGGLYYHFAGDVQAAMLQTLSGGVLHASLALSLGHDVLFGLLALTLVLFLPYLGLRRAPLALLVFGAVVMAGPVTLLRDGVRKLDGGHSVLNLMSLGFRPHVPLAMLMVVGFFGVVALGLVEPGNDRKRWLPHLVVLTAVLAISDEASVALLGLAVGVTWLFDRRFLGASTRGGMVVLGALALALAGAVLLFVGSLGIGSPHYPMRLVAAQAPGYSSAPLRLSSDEGLSVALQDLLPILGVWVAIALAAWRSRDRVLIRTLVFQSALAGLSLFALCCVEVENKSYESHRFVTAILVLTPLLAVVAVSRSRVFSLLGELPAVLMLVSVGLGVASTLEWTESGVATRQCAVNNLFGYESGRLWAVNCRRETGARLFEKTRPMYVEREGFFLYAGCRPAYVGAPPVRADQHAVIVGAPFFGVEALRSFVARNPKVTGSMTVACLSPATEVAHGDPICARAQSLTTCAPAGAKAVRCPLTSTELSGLLAAP